MRGVAVITGLIATLVCPPAAFGHVTLHPVAVPSVPGYVRLDVRVPSERPGDGTTRLELRFPRGFRGVKYEPVAGWRVRVYNRPGTKGAQDGASAAEVSRIVWSRTRGALAYGQFHDFGLRVWPPSKPGSAVSLKALQTYASGEVVHWTGPPSDEPAPELRLLATNGASPDEAAVASSPDFRHVGRSGRLARTTTAERGRSPTWLALIALLVGTVGLVVGLAGLRSRRRAA